MPITNSNAIGDEVILENVSGSPGLPAIDGSQLTGISGGAHAASHTNGTDDIQSATNTQKGLATATQITTLEQAILDDDFTAAEGFMRKTGAGAYIAHKSNLAAAVNPTVNEDSGDGYSIGSLWLNTTADLSFICLDSTVGAAHWCQTSFGCNRYYNEFGTDATTSSTTYVTAYSGSTPSLPSGTYRIDWYLEGDVTDDDVIWQLTIGGVQIFTEHGPRARADHVFQSGYVEKALSGVVAILVEHRSDGGGNAVTHFARISIKRIA